MGSTPRSAASSKAWTCSPHSRRKSSTANRPSAAWRSSKRRSSERTRETARDGLCVNSRWPLICTLITLRRTANAGRVEEIADRRRGADRRRSGPVAHQHLRSDGGEHSRHSELCGGDRYHCSGAPGVRAVGRRQADVEQPDSPEHAATPVKRSEEHTSELQSRGL